MGYARSIAAVAVFELAVAWLVAQTLGDALADRRPLPFVQVAFLVLFVTGVTIAYFDLRSRALSPAIAEARIQALQARIRPHFLYNSINAVLSLIRSEPAPGRARARGHGRPLPRADGRQPHARPDRRRGGARAPVPGDRAACASASACASPGRSTSMPAGCAGAAAHAAAAGGERRLPRDRALARAAARSPSRCAWRASSSSWSSPTRSRARAATPPATGWPSPTSASACSCISTRRRACIRRRATGTTACTIRLPYLAAPA